MSNLALLLTALGIGVNLFGLVFGAVTKNIWLIGICSLGMGFMVAGILKDLTK